jgi:hypothetical protein
MIIGKSLALGACATVLLWLGAAASAQQPKQDPDRPREGADGPPRGGSRPGDRNPPPKAGPKGEGRRGDGPDGFGPGRYGEGKGGPPGGRGPGGWGGPPPDDPEMRELLAQDAELERQTFQMADQVRRARPEDREKLTAQLTELVNKHFDVRQKRRGLQLKRMEEELQRLRDAIKERNDSRASIVKERMTELIGNPDKPEF